MTSAPVFLSRTPAKDTTCSTGQDHLTKSLMLYQPSKSPPSFTVGGTKWLEWSSGLRCLFSTACGCSPGRTITRQRYRLLFPQRQFVLIIYTQLQNYRTFSFFFFLKTPPVSFSAVSSMLYTLFEFGKHYQTQN